MIKYSENNEFIEERWGVPLLNFEVGPGILLLNFKGGPGIPLLNFRGVPVPLLNFEGVLDPGSQGPEVPGLGLLAPLLHHAFNLH